MQRISPLVLVLPFAILSCRAGTPGAAPAGDTGAAAADSAAEVTGGPPMSDSAAAPSLEGTEWMLVELDGTPVPALPDGRRPTLLLDPGEKRASGFAGCNRMTGGYTLSGDSLTFGPMAATKMACVDGPDVETGYLAIFDHVRSWRMDGRSLVLLDGDGQARARFSAP